MFRPEDIYAAYIEDKIKRQEELQNKTGIFIWKIVERAIFKGCSLSTTKGLSEKVRFLFLILATTLVACEGQQGSLALESLSASAVEEDCNETLTPFGGGAGTSASPYLVCSQDHLENMNTDLYADYKITQDLYLTGDFKGINGYHGVFDGGNHTIYNLYNRDQENSTETFINSVFGTVKNLTLSNADVLADESGSGAFFGSVVVGGLLDNVHIKNSITVWGSSNSALVIQNHGTIKNSSVTDTQIYSSGAGSTFGLVYRNFSTGVITNCSASGNTTNVGGDPNAVVSINEGVVN